MSKDVLKIRKKWLIDPETQVHQSKKMKQRLEQEDDCDLRNYVGKKDDVELELELDELEEALKPYKYK